MGRAVQLACLCLALTATCLASPGARGGQGLDQGLQGLGQGGAVNGAADADLLRQWPYGLAPASLYKRLQYNFGLGKRSTGNKLYSFGLGKREADYDDNEVEEDEMADNQLDDALSAEKRARSYEFGLGKRARSYEFGLGKRARSYEFGLGKRARAYEFGLGKRARAYEFGLGKRRAYDFGLGKRAGDRKLYSFGLGKRLPSSERRYSFGLGKRSAPGMVEQADSEEQQQQQLQQATGTEASVVGKREVADKDLRQVAAEAETRDTAPAARSKRAAPYSFGLGKRADEEPEDDDNEDGGVVEVAPVRALTLEDLLEDEDLMAARQARARQYGFGLGKRANSYSDNTKRGPRQQYSFGLGRRSMQYNFGIGKRSVPADAGPAAPADR